MQIKKTYLVLAAGVLIAGVVLGMQIQSVVSSDNTFQQLRKLEEAFSFVTKRYVEDVDSAKLVERAIEGMLEGLDPHSVYIDAERTARWRETFEGSFEGIGIYYEFIRGERGKDTLTVLMPITGGPSEEAGLAPGDRIIQIDDLDAVGFTHDDVERYLKGPKGTQVDVIVRRPGFRQTLDFTITRDKLPIHTVDASYMLDGETGYIKIQRFGRTTYEEFMQAANELSNEGMERLIIDLRYNAGGYMEMATQILDEFLRNNDLIVYTKSRHADLNREFRSRGGGRFIDTPVIVLVDENSASASEIVAGAFQDHDRGIVVGRRTFGKGLVQQQFPLSDGSVLQMTISRYYTPSGRLIQTPYEDMDRDDFRRTRMERLQGMQVVDVQQYIDETPDTLRYQTRRGRTVLGGGGILPDYIVPADTVSPLVEAVIRGRVDQEFARTWFDSHADFRAEWKDRQAEFLREFQLSPQEWEAFIAFARDQGITIADGLQATEASDDERVFDRATFEAERETIETRIKAFMARRVWDVEAFYLVINRVDKTLREAHKLWEPAEEFAAYHVTRR